MSKQRRDEKGYCKVQTMTRRNRVQHAVEQRQDGKRVHETEKGTCESKSGQKKVQRAMGTVEKYTPSRPQLTNVSACFFVCLSVCSSTQAMAERKRAALNPQTLEPSLLFLTPPLMKSGGRLGSICPIQGLIHLLWGF